MKTKPGISAIVTAYDRIDQVLQTIKIIENCEPGPDEILVHVDADQARCRQAILDAFPNLRVLLSTDCVGPGGGRNKLMAAATYDLVASFDDDSYPIDSDYFRRVRHP